jgi:hypothetical protein
MAEAAASASEFEYATLDITALHVKGGMTKLTKQSVADERANFLNLEPGLFILDSLP